jgi:hypothetical protein
MRPLGTKRKGAGPTSSGLIVSGGASEKGVRQAELVCFQREIFLAKPSLVPDFHEGVRGEMSLTQMKRCVAEG